VQTSACEAGSAGRLAALLTARSALTAPSRFLLMIWCERQSDVGRSCSDRGRDGVEGVVPGYCHGSASTNGYAASPPPPGASVQRASKPGSPATDKPASAEPAVGIQASRDR
jgi:hypothetical protein